jgi:hypothetical protein
MTHTPQSDLVGDMAQGFADTATLGYGGQALAEMGTEMGTAGGAGLAATFFGLSRAYTGANELADAKTVQDGNDGWYNMLTGGGTAGLGAGLLMGNPLVAGGGLAFAGGAMAGNYLDEATTSMNLFGNDARGKPQGLTDFAANEGVALEQSARKMGAGDGLAETAGIMGTLATILAPGAALFRHWIE